MLRVVFVLGLGLAAASCGVRPEVQMAQDDQECQSMGAQPGSQPYLQCRMRATRFPNVSIGLKISRAITEKSLAP